MRFSDIQVFKLSRKNPIQNHYILKSTCIFTFFYYLREHLVPNFLQTNQEDEGASDR